MVRPLIRRCIRMRPGVRYFKPRGIPLSALEEVVLAEDGLEAMRLVDLEGMYQDEAAEKMGVSRPTIGRIVEQARKVVVDALVCGKAIRIGGGNDTVRAFGRFGRRRRGFRR